jgi:hypothetical protein
MGRIKHLFDLRAKQRQPEVDVDLSVSLGENRKKQDQQAPQSVAISTNLRRSPTRARDHPWTRVPIKTV